MGVVTMNRFVLVGVVVTCKEVFRFPHNNNTYLL